MLRHNFGEVSDQFEESNNSDKRTSGTKGADVAEWQTRSTQNRVRKGGGSSPFTSTIHKKKTLIVEISDQGFLHV